LGLVLIPAAAYAQDAETPADLPHWINDGLSYLLFFLGLVFTGYSSAEAYARSQVQLEAIPTFPKYMCRKQIYYYGMVVYIISSLLIYSIIVAFYADFLPVIKYMFPQLYKWIMEVTDGEKITYPLLVIVAAIIFVLLLRYEHPRNIVLIIRTLVYRWASVPRKVEGLSSNIQQALNVPDSQREAVLADASLPHVASVDFNKERTTQDRMWAEVSYMLHWLKREKETGLHSTFFNEPSLLWNKRDDEPGILDEYSSLSVLFGRIKSGKEKLEDLNKDGISPGDLANRISRLHRKLRRIVACFLVYKNAKETDLQSDADNFGIPAGVPPLPNPIRQIGIFIVAVLFAVVFGALVSPTIYDMIHTPGQIEPTTSRSELHGFEWAWSFYGVVVNCIPLFLLLCLRYFHEHLIPRQPGFHLHSYAWYLVFGLVFGGGVLTIIAKLSDNQAIAGMGLAEIFVRQIKWASVTGLLCAYVGYRLDLELSFSAKREQYIEQFRAAAILTLLAVTIAAALAFTHDRLPTAFKAAGWTLNKFRWVIILTTIPMAAAVGLAALPGRVRLADESRDVKEQKVHNADVAAM
jgi:hypothetical protein